MDPPRWDDAIQCVLTRMDDTARQVASGFPHWADERTGKWTTSVQGDWTGGYWVGMLWLAFHASGDERYRTWARTWLARLQPRIESETVFKAFLFYYGGVAGAEICGDEVARTAAVDGARALARLYDERLGLIPLGRQAEEGAHVGSAETSIDSLSAAPFLFWAAGQSGDITLRELGVRHTNRLLALHLRAGGTFIQSSSLDPKTGALIRNYTHKGYSDSSTWGRAQCWGLLFAVLSYIWGPKDESWLAAAMQAADWWMAHVPADRVAFWDFDDPAIPDTERDTSATAAAAAALIKLGEVAPAERRDEYRRFGAATVSALVQGHLTPLHPGDDRTPGILTGGCFTKRPDARALDAVSRCELVFADYYLLESLLVLAGRLDPVRI